MATKPRNDKQGITPSWDLVRPSLNLVLANIDKVIFLFLVPALVITLGNIMLGDTRNVHLHSLTEHQIRAMKVLALGALFSLINMAPSLYFRVVAPKKPDIGLAEIYRQGYHYFWRLVGLYLLFAVAVIGGLVLLVLPGLIAIYLILQWYYLAPYYMLERDLGIREALRACKEESEPFRPAIWGIIGVQFIFGIIASLFANLFFHAGGAAADIIGLICLFLPALRYYEIKHASA